MLRKNSRTIALVIPFFTLVACGESITPTTANTTMPTPKITATDLTQSSIGKPTVPVNIAYEFLSEPAVGQPLQVRLKIRSQSDSVSGMSMSMTTRGNLALSKNAPAQIALKSGAADVSGQTYDAVVTAASEGRSYLNVQIVGVYNNQPFTKVVTIPVQVGQGGPELLRNGEIIDTGVEVLSSMPASQSIETESETLQ
ncbi:MAG: hypothetical protein AB8F65_14320 [Woeseiaceae bacterium]